MDELQSGFTIKGKYTIVQKQGEGALGTAIYIGKDADGKEVIIRVIPPALLADDETTTRFIQGANLAQKLKHPNILEVLDAGEDGNTKYLVTNYEKGFFLNEYLEHRGTLDERESIKLVKSLAEALKYAWEEMQIIHRNICPDSILVAKGNVPLLTDFDLAKSLVADNKLTVEGLAIGNPLYMSPEQAKGLQLDFRSDIYCLGLVLYQLLAGKPPFSDQSKMDVLRSQLAEKHAPIQSRNKDVSDACSSVLDKMLEKKSTNRYQTWDEVINDLDAILNQEAPSTVKQVKSLKPTSSRYKMQAINMNTMEIKAAVAAKKKGTQSAASPETPKKEEPIPAAAETKTVAAAPEEPKKTQMTTIAMILIFLVFLGVLGIGVYIQRKGAKEDKNYDVTPIDDTKQVTKTETKPEVKLKPKAEPKTEPKPVVKTEPKPQPKVETKPVVKKPTIADKEREAKYRQVSVYNIKQIGEALQMYANVFEGKFPEPNGAKGLDLLRSKGFLRLPQIFICPSTGNLPSEPGKPITEKTCDYVYVGGYSEYSKGKLPMLWSKPNNHKEYGIILYVNGEIKEFKGNNWLFNTKVKK